MSTAVHHSRCAALGALDVIPLAGLPAIDAVPVESIAAHPDAELFTLVERLQELDRASTAAWAAAEDAEGRVQMPAPPAAFCVREGDAALWPTLRLIGEPISANMIQFLVAWSADFLTEDDEKYANQDLRRAFRARSEELAAANKDHAEAKRAACESAGATEAERRAEGIAAEWRKAAHQVARMRARTVDGIMAKLCALADFYDAGDEGDGEANSDDILHSAVADALALSQSA